MLILHCHVKCWRNNQCSSNVDEMSADETSSDEMSSELKESRCQLSVLSIWVTFLIWKSVHGRLKVFFKRL